MTDSAALQLDPYEKPPQELKDLFKLWRRANDLEELQELRLTHVGSIAESDIKDAFRGFQSRDPEVAALYAEPVPDVSKCGGMYGSDDIPGLLVLPALLPAAVQQELLSQLLHRDLSDPNHRTNLHLHYDVTYPEKQSSFFSETPDTVSFRPRDPSVHKPQTVSDALQKKVRWMTLGGQYDWTNKSYPEEEPPSFPDDVARLVQGLFPDMKAQAAIVNLYSPGDTLSLHRDVSEEVNRGLVSISLGCDAIFIIGLDDPESGGTRSLVVRLQSGDALYMSGESRYGWHGVPCIVPGTCPDYLQDWPGAQFPWWKGWMKGKRINLNVRQMWA